MALKPTAIRSDAEFLEALDEVQRLSGSPPDGRLDYQWQRIRDYEQKLDAEIDELLGRWAEAHDAREKWKTSARGRDHG